jgi:hypothetical protein
MLEKTESAERIEVFRRNEFSSDSDIVIGWVKVNVVNKIRTQFNLRVTAISEKFKESVRNLRGIQRKGDGLNVLKVNQY